MIAASRYPAFSRNFDDEQDYADAAVSAARRASPLLGNLAPILRWKTQRDLAAPSTPPAAATAAVGNGSGVGIGSGTGVGTTKRKFKTLVVGFEGGGASFARDCFGLCEADWIGTLILPGACSSSSGTAAATTSTQTAAAVAAAGGADVRGAAAAAAATVVRTTTGGLGDSLDPTDPLNSACNIFHKRGGGGGERGDDAEESSGGSGVAVALCAYSVPPAQAHAWAKALLGGIEAEVVVALETIAVEPGRSEGWEGARFLATSEAEEREDCVAMSRGFRPLPTPTMLSGPAAALVSYCQRHGQAAMCFAAAELPRWKRLGGGGSTRRAERSLACTRESLSVVAGGAVVMAAASGDGDAVGTRGGIADDALSTLYV